MERAEVIAFLEKLEQKYPVNEWKSGDAQIWPIVKWNLFSNWFASSNPSNSSTQQSTGVVSKALKVISSYKKWLLLKAKKRLAVDKLLLGAGSHRVILEDKFVNRYYYPLVVDDGNMTYKILEYGERQNKNYHPAKTIFIEEYLFVNLFIIKKKRRKEFIAPEWNRVIKDTQNFLKVPLEDFERKLFKNLQSFWAYVKVFSKLMDKYPATECIGLCYYNLQMFAAQYVANKKEIPNWDMQHGGQGRLHPMYYYSNPPGNGYNILPKNLWCWDDASANNIRKWIKKQHFHQVFVKGNPWVKFQLGQMDKVAYSEKNIILYTLQEEQLDDYIIKTIENTPASMEWWLRLHPRKQQAKKKIYQQLKEAGLEKRVIIDRATNLPLPLILNQAKVHISKFSGSIIEAAQVGTKTIIIDPIGVATYGDYIQNDNAVVCLEQKSAVLLATIKEMIENKEHVVNSKN